LNADVPVGCFFKRRDRFIYYFRPGNTTSSNIHTFSIGFKDEPFFDETEYAKLVAKHIGSNHHEFKLSNNDFLDHIHPF